MDKGLGIAALVLAILGIFVPIYGIAISGLALVLAAIGALAGERVFATATPLIAAVNTFAMSPSVWLLIEGMRQEGKDSIFYVTAFAFLAAPFIAMMLNASGKVALNRN